MTIYTYYHIFGFQVSLKEYMNMHGYNTIDNISEEIRKEIEEDYGEDTDEGILVYWFENYHLKEDTRQHSFKIGGGRFTAMTYTHDSKEYNKCIVIGIKISEMSNFTGNIKKFDIKDGTNPLEAIQFLVKDKKYAKLIKNSEEDNSCSYVEKEFGVKCKYGSIVPSLFTLTDDCDCCS
jgi:hypothetical protein